jgi:hypothetical protein
MQRHADQAAEGKASRQIADFRESNKTINFGRVGGQSAQT